VEESVINDRVTDMYRRNLKLKAKLESISLYRSFKR